MTFGRWLLLWFVVLKTSMPYATASCSQPNVLHSQKNRKRMYQGKRSHVYRDIFQHTSPGGGNSSLWLCSVGSIQPCLHSFWVVGDFWVLGVWWLVFSNAWHYFQLCDSAQAAAALFDILVWNKQPAAHWLSLISKSCLYPSLFLPPSCILPFFLVIALIGLVCYPAAPHGCQRKVVQHSADRTYCTMRSQTHTIKKFKPIVCNSCKRLLSLSFQWLLYVTQREKLLI